MPCHAAGGTFSPTVSPARWQTVAIVVDPGVIVIGGGLSNVELLITDLNAEVAPLVFTDQFTTPIVKAQHGDSSGTAWRCLACYAQRRSQ